MTAPLLRPVASSWIAAVGYSPLCPEHRRTFDGGDGFVFVKLRKSGETLAYLAPSWARGLLTAGPSVGRAFHRLLKGQPCVKVPTEIA